MKWPQCSILKVVCNKLMNDHSARSNHFGSQTIDSWKVMLFEKSLTGDIGVLVPVLENYANPI
jgi:hypothetical protein